MKLELGFCYLLVAIPIFLELFLIIINLIKSTIFITMQRAKPILTQWHKQLDLLKVLIIKGEMRLSCVLVLSLLNTKVKAKGGRAHIAEK